jgi:AbiV family abortive infection protein
MDDSIRGKRDRALLSTLLFHALRREELRNLKVKDFQHARKGVPHLKVSGKGGKTRYLPLHPGTHALVHDYIKTAGHGEDDTGALFRPIRNNATGELDKAISPDGVYKLVRAYSAALGFQIGAHALRATAATNALDHEADIAKVQDWLGHANISTTRIYDHRRTRHAKALLESARAVIDTGHPNIAFHLAVLALEELGRRELIGLQSIIDTRPVPPGWAQKHTQDYVKKLFWCFFGGSFFAARLTKEHLESLEDFAQRLHAKRLAGLYVDQTDDSLSIPSDAIDNEERRGPRARHSMFCNVAWPA